MTNAINSKLQTRIDDALNQAKRESSLLTCVLGKMTDLEIAVQSIYPHAYCGDVSVELDIQAGELAKTLKALAPLELVYVAQGSQTVKPKEYLTKQELDYGKIVPVFPIFWKTEARSTSVTRYKWYTKTSEGHVLAVQANLLGGRFELEELFSKNTLQMNSYGHSTGNCGYAEIGYVQPADVKVSLLEQWFARWPEFVRVEGLHTRMGQAMNVFKSKMVESFFFEDLKGMEHCKMLLAERLASLDGFRKVFPAEKLEKLDVFLKEQAVALVEALEERKLICAEIDKAVQDLCLEFGVPTDDFTSKAMLGQYVLQKTGYKLHRITMHSFNPNAGRFCFELVNERHLKEYTVDIKLEGRKCYMQSQNIPVEYAPVVIA